MRTLLVVTRQPSMASAIETVLDSAEFQLIVKEEIVDAEFLLVRGAVDAVILDLDLSDVQAIRAISEVKSFAPNCPILVYANAKQSEREEEAYMHGVEHVLTKPVRGRLLGSLLSRLFPEPDRRMARSPMEMPIETHLPRHAPQQESMRALEALRRFSGVLAHGLDAFTLLQQFLLLLREVMGVNRAIIFLRKPASLITESPLSPEDRWLHSVCAIGLDRSVLEHFALSLGAGIGGHLHRHGRIIRAGSIEAQGSREIAREFQILGTKVAVPILDRHSLLGVALFDERLTGEPYTPEELAILFQLLEEVGLAIRNAWQHRHLLVNHQMVAEILSRLGSSCVVIGAGMEILHSNSAARTLFQAGTDSRNDLEFSDIPQHLGSMVYTVLKAGVTVQPFKHAFATLPGRDFRVSIVPFHQEASGRTDAALLTVEEITDYERAQKLEIETVNLKLVKAMAEHLAHEIGNALVPLSTHQQLLKEMPNDAELQETLVDVLGVGVRRIGRLASQMNFLAREWQGNFHDLIQISDLIVEAFHDAHTYHPGKRMAQLSFNKQTAPWKVSGDYKALRHAFSEIILNALQANPEAPTIAVELQEVDGSSDELQVEVRDSGSGFTDETASRAAEPFFSTRNVGLGIGLTVSRRIIESHHGRLEIPPPRAVKSGVVRVSLPIHN
jgi:signal transduction histidine kinase/DNA-binding NarL/FixJ family response regulator